MLGVEQDLLAQSLRILSISRRLECLIQWKASVPRNCKLVQCCVQQCLNHWLSSAPQCHFSLFWGIAGSTLAPRRRRVGARTFSASFFPIVGLIFPNPSLRNSMP